MSIEIQCRCGKAYRVKDELAGKQLRCKACNAPMRVPSIKTATEKTTPMAASARAAKVKAKPDPLPMDEPLPLPPGGGGASNPGCAAVDFARYFFCYPGIPLFILFFALVGLTGSVASGQWWLLPVCIAVGCYKAIRFIPSLRYNIKRFRTGNVNPGVVLERAGLFSWKVAIFTDLSSSGGNPKPAIFIGTFPLSRMAGGPPKPGMRIAAPTLYGGYPDRESWSFIRPMVANCSVSNPLTLNRLLASVPHEEWGWLDDYLPLVPSQKCDLYPLWPGGKLIPVPKQSAIVNFGFWLAISVIAIACTTVISLKLQNKLPNSDAPVIPPESVQPQTARPRPIPQVPPPVTEPEQSTSDKVKQMMGQQLKQAEEQRKDFDEPGKKLLPPPKKN